MGGTGPMRPIKLTISAFCAYSNTVVIDFTKLGEKGLYLITGDTGAGKTTIFDAICYALYGKPSGDIRNEKMLRSKYAKPEIKTYVELEFLCGNKIYTIHRNPEYIRPKKGRPNEFTSEKASVYLKYQDGRVITGINEIKTAIKEIVGLDEKRFKQIVMIAQGDFLKVLNATTEERTKIFRDIFHTEPYERLQKSLYELSADLKRKYKLINDQIASEVSHLECDEHSELYEEFSDLKVSNRNSAVNISEIIEIMKKINSDDERTISDLNERIFLLDKQREQLGIKIENAERTRKLTEELEKIRQRIKLGDEYCKNAALDFESKESNIKKAERLAVEIEGLNEKLPIYEQLKDCTNNKKVCEDKYKEWLIEIDNLKKDISDSKNKLEQNQKRFEELKDSEINGIKTENKIKELDVKLKDLKKFIGILTQYNNLNITLDILKKEMDNLNQNISQIRERLEIFDRYEVDLQKEENSKSELISRLNETESLNTLLNEYKNQDAELNYTQSMYISLQSVYDSKNEIYISLYRKFLNMQAGIIASTLRDNERCPVCGSLSHPFPAQLESNAPTENDVNNAKYNMEISRKNMEAKSVKCEKIRSALSEKKKQIQQKIIQLYSSDFTISELCENINDNINSIKDRIQKSQDLIKKYNLGIKEKQQLEVELKKNIEIHQNTENKYLNTASELKQYKIQIEENSKTFYSEIFENNILSEKLKSNIYITEKEIEVKKSLLRRYNSELKEKNEISEQIKNINFNIEKLSNNINAAVQESKINLQKCENYNDRISEIRAKLTYKTYTEAQNKIAEMQSEKQRLEEEYKKSYEQLNKYNIGISGLKSKEEVIKKQLRTSEKEDVSMLIEQKNFVNQQYKFLTNEKESLMSRQNLNLKTTNNIILKQKEFEDAERQFICFNNLSDTANAALSGKEKITLETYVQIKYFERVLARANVRFMVMSNGQYEFVHAEQAESNRSKTGLEIDITDHYNGTRRSAKSLSGGESFMASLSLALGLADEIQSQSGGIKIDTMFIDEGFGSLSEEALNQSVNVLSGLTESNRLVGIISHVSELKERINNQIIVAKNRFGGSTVKIES